MRAMTDDEKELGAIIIRAQAKQYGDEETLATVAERAYRLGHDAAQRETASLRHAALLAAGIHGGPGAWRWVNDPQGTILDDEAAWERLLGEMREVTRQREERSAKRAAEEEKRAAYRLKVIREGYCMADRDGDCGWEDCPQTADGEPAKSGRHCPRDDDAHRGDK